MTALNKSEPVLEFIRPYTPDFTGWLRDFGQSTANYDANGHYARIQPIFNAFQLTDNTLVPQSAANRGRNGRWRRSWPCSGRSRAASP